MTGHSTRAARALAHLAEVDPALAVLALWCGHRDAPGPTRTAGDTILYGAGFDALALPEQVGLVAHHVLHVALRHGARQAALAERLGDGWDSTLFGLAADAIVNETLQLAGQALPRPAILLADLLAKAGLPANGPIDALERWDVARLSMALHADPDRKRHLRDWAREKGFEPDVVAAPAGDRAGRQTEADWRNQMLRALEAGRKAGSGIGRLGAILADMAAPAVPWEVRLRGLLARALVEHPQPTWRRPSGRWIARLAEAERTGTQPPAFEPGRTPMDRRPRIVIGLDTSSSIAAQTLRLFTAEARGIARRTGAEAHLLAFDETVFLHRRLDPHHWRLDETPMRQGGGTDFRDLFAQAAALDPSVVVVLTDLDAPLPPPPGFALVWAVPGATAQPGYGRLLRLDDVE